MSMPQVTPVPRVIHGSGTVANDVEIPTSIWSLYNKGTSAHIDCHGERATKHAVGLLHEPWGSVRPRARENGMFYVAVLRTRSAECRATPA